MLGAVTIAATLTVVPVHAAQDAAMLSGLEINSVNGAGYNIVLKADKNIKVEKLVNNKNNIVLDLKGVITSDTLNTIYNNVPEVDSVVFQPVSKNHVKVHLQGRNISASSIAVESGLLSSSFLKRPKQETLVLNKPINSYAPITKPVETVELAQKSILQDSYPQAFNLEVFSNVFNKANAGWLVSLLMLGMFLITNLIKPREKKVTIDLDANYKERELALYKEQKRNEGLIGSGLKGSAQGITRKSALVGSNNASNKNYGLNAYKNSQVDPYRSQRAVSKMKTESRITPVNSRTIASKNLQGSRTVPNRTPLRTRTNVDNKQVEQAKVNIDSVKFLESMAKIYEKSGRVDLAHGLHTNIKKAKMQRQA